MIVVVFVRLTGLVETTKEALVAPPGTVTVAGTEATDELLLSMAEFSKQQAPSSRVWRDLADICHRAAQLVEEGNALVVVWAEKLNEAYATEPTARLADAVGESAEDMTNG